MLEASEVTFLPQEAGLPGLRAAAQAPLHLLADNTAVKNVGLARSLETVLWTQFGQFCPVTLAQPCRPEHLT